jgi:MoaA/NifB/PqqE/SkfB family radical SAM enzyme
MSNGTPSTAAPGTNLAAIVRKTWAENLLFSVLLELTYRCNLDCFFCYNDLGKRGEPLSTERYLELLEEFRGMGVFNLILSGGEPLVHPDFFTLSSRARELGFVVRLKSNGHLLGERTARRLKEEVDPFLVEISLHGATAEVHDRQTRVTGSFDRLMTHLPILRGLGLRVKLNSTLTAWNEHQLEEMMALAERLELPLQIDPDVTPRDDGDSEPLSVAASREGRLRLFRLQEAARQSSAATESAGGDAPTVSVGRPTESEVPGVAGKHCGAGSSTVAIDPYGNVFPCVQWRRPVGNLHRSSMREIWAEAPGLQEVRRLGTEVATAVAERTAGDAAAAAGFCPGAAWSQTGSATGIYPAAEADSELRRQAGKEVREILLPIVS